MTNAPLTEAQGSASASQPTLMNVHPAGRVPREQHLSAAPEALAGLVLDRGLEVEVVQVAREEGVQMARKDGGRDGEEAVRQTQRLR